MTNQQLNKTVAETLGLDIIKTGRNAGLVCWRGQNHEEFNPATKPADAVWALERSGKNATLLLHKEPDRWCCQIIRRKEYYWGTFCEVISRAIVGTGGRRNGPEHIPNGSQEPF